MAEISVPAWPMPIQKTKLVMSKAQATGHVVAPHADAGGDQVADQQEENDGPVADEGEGHVPGPAAAAAARPRGRPSR